MASAPKSTKTIRLWYLGGIRVSRPNAKVTAGGQTLSLPPLGEYIDLPEHQAIDLERKHTYLDPKSGEQISVFTRDPRVAKRVKEGMSGRDAVRSIVLGAEAMTTEQLLEELRKRGEEVPKVEAKAKAPAKPRAKAKPKASVDKKAEEKTVNAPAGDPLGL